MFNISLANATDGISSGAITGNIKAKNVGGTISSQIAKMQLTVDSSLQDATVSASSSNQDFVLVAHGVAGQTVRWVGNVEFVQSEMTN